MDYPLIITTNIDEQSFQILGAYDLDVDQSSSKFPEETVRLLKLRAPAGSGIFEGKWQPYSKFWNEDLKAQIKEIDMERGSYIEGEEADENGIFFISQTELMEEFTGIAGNIDTRGMHHDYYLMRDDSAPQNYV